MYNPPKNIDSLIHEAEENHLYFKLIEQINKDFGLANELLDIPYDIFPLHFKERVEDKVYELIQNRFASYLNLLYIIDVSEKEIKELDGSDIAILAQQVTFLILKREWQKVWFRNNY